MLFVADRQLVIDNLTTGLDGKRAVLEQAGDERHGFRIGHSAFGERHCERRGPIERHLHVAQLVEGL